ncbi:MAG: NUDIX hydrolase, partial [Steroidobacteraceae bacterium]
MSAKGKLDVSIGLSVAIVSVADERPSVLVVHHVKREDALPFGPFDPLDHRTLEGGLRQWVERQTYLGLGYAEQLYTFGDRGRHLPKPGEDSRVVSVGYLALTRQAAELKAPDTRWSDWYRYFPWEDWRDARPALIDNSILPALRQFARAATGELAERRRDRIRLCFGTDGLSWDEEKVLERYELLYEAGLVREAVRDGRKGVSATELGESMMFDHRRILATAIARLRGKMKYRPVVFELM